MKYRNILIVSILTLFSFIQFLSADDQIKLIKPSEFSSGWNIFGLSSSGGLISKNNNHMKLEVDWEKTSWGIGISYKLPIPMDGRKLKGIKAELKASGGNKVRVHAGLSNKAGGNLSQDMRLAKEITSQWKEFEFLVSEMAPNLQQALSPTFGDRNFDNVQYIHLFFLKPRGNAEDKDSILIQTPVLTYVEENIYAAHKN